MIHPPSEKDRLLLAVLACLEDPSRVTAWNLTSERQAILFDLDDVTYRVREGGSVEETDGHIASWTKRTGELQDSIQKFMAEERYRSEEPGRSTWR